MIKCKCGTWTNLGLSCSKCTLEDNSSKFEFGSEEDTETVSLTDIHQLEEAAEEFEDEV